LLNCKIEKPNDSPLSTCLREWTTYLSIIKNTFYIIHLKCTTLRLIIQLLNMSDVIHAIWFAN
jgi:hypothetical protein